MFNKGNRKQLIGSLVSIINSGFNFGIYIFLPIFIGIESFTNFQIQNVKSSFIILLFSPSLPYIVYKKKSIAFSFFILFLAAALILLFISSKLLLFANITWLLYGLIAMILYYDDQKKKFYYYTLFLTISQIISLFIFKDYYMSFIITSFTSFFILLIIEKNTIYNFLLNIDIKFSRDALISLLRPVFSISFFWQITLYFASKHGSNDFLSLTYYSKISLSTTVAIFTISSLDILKERKIESKNFIILCFLSFFAVNALIIILDYFGKNNLNLNFYIANLLLLGSILPTLVFNLVSDSFYYRILLLVIFVFSVCLILFGVNIFMITGLGLFAISIVSYFTFISSTIKKNEY